MLSQYSSIFHEFLRNGILGKHSLLVRVIICATNKFHKAEYLRKRLSWKCLFWAYRSLPTFPSRLGRTITLSREVAMETNLQSPFPMVFFLGMLYLSKILTAMKQTFNPRGLKNRICISSLQPHPPPFKGMSTDKLVAHKFHQQWSIFPSDRCWQRACCLDEGKAVTVSLWLSCWLQSHLQWTQVLCPDLKDENHSSYWEEHRKHRIIVHQHQNDQAGSRKRNENEASFIFRVLKALTK